MDSSGSSAAGPLIHGIPLALWVTIAVSVISPIVTVLGIWWSNWNAGRLQQDKLEKDSTQFRQKLSQDSTQFGNQLQHDAHQRDRDRQMSMRREVYLDAAAALVHLQHTYSQASDIKIDVKEVNASFAKNQAAIAKTHIVGTQATVDAVMAYTNALGAAYVELLSRRPSLEIRKAAIDTHDALMMQAHDDRVRCNRMLEQYNLEGANEPQRWQMIQKQYEFATERWEDQNAKRAALQAEQLRETIEISNRLIEMNGTIIPHLPRAVLAVRAELEMQIDSDWYTAQWLDQVQQAGTAWMAAKERFAKLKV